MKDISEIKYGYTHGSVFHADDVFATALLLTLNPFIQITRTNRVDPEMLSDDSIIYDIGEGEYDHHQKDKATRSIEDGYYFDKDGMMQKIPYCSFGLLWRDFGTLLCPSEKAWKKVDHDLVLPIDKADNGVMASTLSSMIGKFNPFWTEDDSDADRYSAFMESVEFAKKILDRYVLAANSEVKAEDAVKNSTVLDNSILVLDRFLPWQDVVVNNMENILFVVFPSNRGGYNVQTVPDAPGSFNGRKLFPREWLGNPDSSLGMTFCHPGNFLLATETLSQAINCARIAISR